MMRGASVRNGGRIIGALLAVLAWAAPVSAATGYSTYGYVTYPGGSSDLYGGTAVIEEFLVVDGQLAAQLSFAGTSIADPARSVGPVALTVTNLVIVTLGTCDEGVIWPVAYVWLDPGPVPLPGTANTIDVAVDRWVQGIGADVPRRGDASLCRLWRSWTRAGNPHPLANALNASLPYLTP